VREKREKTVDMKMDTHLVPLIPGVTGVLGKIYPLRPLEKVSYLPLKYTLKKFHCRSMNPELLVLPLTIESLTIPT
jgi:hypothetical protein